MYDNQKYLINHAIDSLCEQALIMLSDTYNQNADFPLPTKQVVAETVAMLLSDCIAEMINVETPGTLGACVIELVKHKMTLNPQRYQLHVNLA